MINNIRLQNIRCFKDRTFSFSPDINLIIGDNGSGKTTLIESVAFFSFGKFLSISSDFSAVTFTQEIGRIEAQISDNDNRSTASVAITKGAKISQINSKKVSNSQIVGLQKAVLFNPETIELVCGPPEVRRRELNFIACQGDKGFVRTLLRFKNVLKQRNSLLREIGEGKAKIDEIDFWDKEFVKLSNLIYQKRVDVISSLNAKISQTHQNLIGTKSDLVIRLAPSTDYERLAEALVATMEGDAHSGTTSLGPHRDDFSFNFHGNSLKDHSSRGEQRLAALALKIESARMLSQDGPSLIILDDVFSELDFKRRKSLAENLPKSQIIVSATDEKVVPELLKDRELVINL